MLAKNSLPPEMTLIKLILAKNKCTNLTVLNRSFKKITLDISPEKLQSYELSLFDSFLTNDGKITVLGFDKKNNLWCVGPKKPYAEIWDDINDPSDLKDPNIKKLAKTIKNPNVIKYVKENPSLANLVAAVYKKIFLDKFSAFDTPDAINLLKAIFSWINHETSRELIKNNWLAISEMLEKLIDDNTKLLAVVDYEAAKEIDSNLHNQLEILSRFRLITSCDITVIDNKLRLFKDVFEKIVAQESQKFLNEIDHQLADNNFFEAISICRKTVFHDYRLSSRISTKYKEVKELKEKNDRSKPNSVSVIRDYENYDLLEKNNLELIIPNAECWIQLQHLFYYEENDTVRLRTMKVQKYYQTLLENGNNVIHAPKRYSIYAIRDKNSHDIFAAAFICLNNRNERLESKLISLVTRPNLKNKGYGSLLLIAMMETLKTQGCSYHILKSSDVGIPSYIKLGFNLNTDNKKFQHINEINSIKEKIEEVEDYQLSSGGDTILYFNMNDKIQMTIFADRIQELKFRQNLRSENVQISDMESSLQNKDYYDSIFKKALEAAEDNNFFYKTILSNNIELMKYILQYYNENVDASILENYFLTAKKLNKPELCSLFGYYLLLKYQYNDQMAIYQLLDSEKDAMPFLLHVVASAGDTNLMNILVRLEFPINSQDSLGNTPLMLACKARQVELVKFLIENCKADPFIFNIDNKEVLGIAKESCFSLINYLATIKLNRLLASAQSIEDKKSDLVLDLMQYRPDLSYTFPGDDTSTMEYAKMKGFTEVVPFTIVDRTRTLSNHRNNWFYELEDTSRKKQKTDHSFQLEDPKKDAPSC